MAPHFPVRSRRATGGTSQFRSLLAMIGTIMSCYLGIVILGSTPAAATCASTNCYTPPPRPKQTAIDPELLEKWIQPLKILPVIPAYDQKHPDPSKPFEMSIGMWETFQEFHPYFGKKTRIYAYGRTRSEAYTPGPIIQVLRHHSNIFQWTNNLPADHFIPIDYTLVESNYPPPGSHKGIGTTVHLHGGETSPMADGHPQSWFTNPEHCNRSVDSYICTGSAYTTNIFRYDNSQLPSTYLFHDHTLGLTANNVFAGLVGGYAIVDPKIEQQLDLPSGDFHIVLIFQDKIFTEDGQLFYPTPPVDAPIQSDFHPGWTPEVFGSIPIVNGQVWPYLEVERCQYRFEFVQGSNARFFRFSVPDNRGMDVPFWILGTDGGYLEKPVRVSRFLVGPSQRRQVLINFAMFDDSVTELIVENDASAPYPGGDPVPSDDALRQLLKFKLLPRRDGISQCRRTTPLPKHLINLPSLVPKKGREQLKRYHILMENEYPRTGGLTNILISNTTFRAPASENIKHLSYERWCFINISPDSHPMHLHLVQFRPAYRQSFDVDGYINGSCQIGQTISVEGRPVGPIPKHLLPSCLTGRKETPTPDEDGFLDSVICPPGKMTCINIRMSSQKLLPEEPDAVVPFDFDPTKFPGYVWHCHIVEHEDNQMMRPLMVYNGFRSTAWSFEPSLYDMERMYQKRN